MWVYGIGNLVQLIGCILIISTLLCAGGVCCTVNLWIGCPLRSLHIKRTITTMAKTTAIIMTLNIMVSVLSNGPMCSKALFIYIWPNVIVELSKVQHILQIAEGQFTLAV